MAEHHLSTSSSCDGPLALSQLLTETTTPLQDTITRHEQNLNKQQMIIDRYITTCEEWEEKWNNIQEQVKTYQDEITTLRAEVENQKQINVTQAEEMGALQFTLTSTQNILSIARTQHQTAMETTHKLQRDIENQMRVIDKQEKTIVRQEEASYRQEDTITQQLVELQGKLAVPVLFFFRFYP